MYKDEREIGKKAEQMLQDALRQKVSGFKQHATGRVEEVLKRLEDATAKARLKKYGLVREGTAQYYMRSLSIKMEKHGFVQHYGVDTIRADGHRKRNKPKTTEYGYKTHYMKMKAQPFIDSAISQSGVVPFVLREVNKHRGEELMLLIKKFMEE